MQRLLLGLLVTGALTQACGGDSNSDRTPTVVLTAAVPVTPTPGGEPLVCEARADVDNDSPSQHTDVVLSARLECSSGSPGGSLMTSTWNFRNQKRICENAASPEGHAKCVFPVGNATRDYWVRVDVQFEKAGQTWTTSTGFTVK